MPLSRYRERAPPNERSFYGDSKGKKPVAGTVTVVRKNFVKSKLQSSINLHLTGTPKDSFALERCWDETHPGPPYKSGGPFAKFKISMPHANGKPISFTTKSAGFLPSDTWQEVSGIVYPTSVHIESQMPYVTFVGTGQTVPFDFALFPDASGFGTQAWDKTRPQIAKAGMSVFLAELRDLPGMLKTSARGFHEIWSATRGHFDAGVQMLPKRAADHFLNHNFGWVPFISDLIKFYNTYEKTHDHIMQLVRDNGQWIRRKRTLKKETVRERVGSRLYSPGFQPYGADMEFCMKQQTVDGINCYGFCDSYSETTEKVWAEGLFRYYRPEFDPNSIGFPSGWSNIKRLLSLYGARINPSIVWKVTPWTWLIDWFSGIGRNIDVLTEQFQDGVAAKYLYVMHHRQREIVTYSNYSTYDGWRQHSWPWLLETKQRVSADSPFGFNLSWSHLSARQWAILGAIGVSRSNFG
jgi:hypothetical protein